VQNCTELAGRTFGTQSALMVTQYLYATMAFSHFFNLYKSFWLILGRIILLSQASILNSVRFMDQGGGLRIDET
jgi:hypothetical protein